MNKIMFNDKYGLTKAVMEGRKTQTRRVIEKRLMDKIQSFQEDYFNASLDYLKGKDLIEAYFLNYPKQLPYKVREVVAVAQSYSDSGNLPDDMEYDEENYPIMPKRSGYFNKMFVKAELMPHQILITGIRVERLQDISDEDCLKEGIIKKYHSPAAMNFYYVPNVEVKSPKDVYTTPQEAYATLIDKVSGKGTWEKNPYVFVYDFELLK